METPDRNVENLTLLNETFIELLHRYNRDSSLHVQLWSEIQKNYSSKNRHYHTLAHLDNILNVLLVVRTEIQHWDCILFTLYYHDVIYNSLKSDNEEKSAEVAQKRMKQLGVDPVTIARGFNQILATKTHLASADLDTNYFTDADLSVLGQSWETYSQYYKNVRKEYSIYPDFMYKPGRKKVLNHFLSMDRIFKTEFFYTKFEGQARRNLQMEIELL